ncbi:hypothetical protein [Prosthecochloris sp.]|uniref:hypothetical protein n=1 Tax=Prosthecochloris sp. TaxID=290513 RepID=UPI0025EF281B|nr:hypothetical protein [Prosthecochloris sp.]
MPSAGTIIRRSVKLRRETSKFVSILNEYDYNLVSGVIYNFFYFLNMEKVEFKVGNKLYRYELPPVTYGAEVILQDSDGKEKLRYTGAGVRYFVLNPETGEWKRKKRPVNKHINKLMGQWLHHEFMKDVAFKWKNLQLEKDSRSKNT